MASDELISDCLRRILGANIGACISLGNMLEIGQLENLNFWVEYREGTANGKVFWEQETADLEEAVSLFVSSRKELELGFDFETELN